MSVPEEPVHLAVSVGGSKCAFAVVGQISHTVLARSKRVEWTSCGIDTIEGFVAMLAQEFQRLLTESMIPADRVTRVGAAWPGPGVSGRFQATFIPGCQTPQPIPHFLQMALARALGSRLESVPVRVMLDAVARAAGETWGGGAFHFSPGSAGSMLVNIATGIAGGIVRQGKALLVYPGIGQNYGQFGRFLFLDTATGTWDWRPTSDGSVPDHSPQEVRWTRHCAGPALARRIARWPNEWGDDSRGRNEEVAEAFRYYQPESAPRHPAHEMTLLRWATTEAVRQPEGSLAGFIKQVAWEVAGALRALLRVFASDHIDQIVLAGGVGENFGRSDDLTGDPFLAHIERAMGQGRCAVGRARLGVDAEFLGLASDSFIPAS